LLLWWFACVDGLSARRGTARRTTTTATATTDPPACVLAARVGRLWRTSAWARAGRAFVFRSCRLIGGCSAVGRVARSLALVASASVASANGWARLGEGGWVGWWAGGNAVCIDLLLSLPWRMCAAAGGVGHVIWRVCLFARCWRRPMYGVVLLFGMIATAAAALVRYVVCGD
jgi:hypothetical protein